MGAKLFIANESAIEVWRALRSTGLSQNARPSRIRTVRDCAHTTEQIVRALEGIDPALASAARMRMGAGVGDTLHLACADPASRPQIRGMKGHVWGSECDAGTFWQLSDDVFVLSPESAFERVARRLSLPRRVMLAMELSGSYTFDPSSGDYVFGVAPVTSVSKLLERCLSTRPSHGSQTQRTMQTLQWCADNSASPMETIVVMLLVLPYRLGGYGLSVPSLNVALDADGNIVPRTTRGCTIPDIVWLAHMIALEYNGRSFHCGIDDYSRDSDRRDKLERLGYQVIPISAEKLYDPQRFHDVALMVARRTGKELRLPSGFESKRDALRSEILPRLRG